MTTRTTIEHRLRRARSRVTRFTPDEAHAAAARGAVIVDVRRGDDRRRDGGIRAPCTFPFRCSNGGATPIQGVQIVE